MIRQDQTRITGHSYNSTRGYYHRSTSKYSNDRNRNSTLRYLCRKRTSCHESRTTYFKSNALDKNVETRYRYSTSFERWH